jgi:hypothetical protein
VEDLEGVWRVERSFGIERGEGPERFTGRVVVRRDPGGGWLWSERGRVTTPRGPLPARRSYWIVPARGGALDLYFADDGAPPSPRSRFVRLTPDGSGGLVGEHRCGADRYVGSYRLARAALRIEWRVEGPRKSARIRSRLTREAPSGTGEAPAP